MTKNKKKLFNSKILLITGGTGSFGNFFLESILEDHPELKKIIIFSRDEYKQYLIKKKFENHKYYKKIRFFIGDIRDKERLRIALRGVDFVIHTAALKQIDTAEYNPTEFISTNIVGTKNLVECSIYENIKKIIFLSTDKACSPANLYGATKLCAEKLIISANHFTGKNIFSVVRYGNVFNSRGSIFPLFKNQSKNNLFTITNKKMTRFNISLLDAYKTVIWAFFNSKGGEIIIPKLNSYRIIDLATAINPTSKIKIIGMRPGEKIHEDLMSEIEPGVCLETKNYYLLIDDISYKKNTNFFSKYKYIEKFNYNSGSNKKFLNVKILKKLIDKNQNKFL